MADGDMGYSGAIYQTLTGLTPGRDYTVSFYQAAGQQQGCGGATTDSWGVWFGSAYQRSSVMSLASHAVGQWQAQSMTFTAGGASQVLSFLAMGTPNGAPLLSFLDGGNVALAATAVPPATAVPEPASLAVLGAGLLGLGMACGLWRRTPRRRGGTR